MKLPTLIECLGESKFVIHVSKDATDDEIDEVTRAAIPVVLSQNEGFCCAISGYNDDKRELYQIPEVKKLCQRLCDRGLISMLMTSTLIEKEEKPWCSNFFGALEIWSIAKGYLTDNLEIQRDMFQMFLADLDKSNSSARKLEPKCTDGMHRTKVGF